MFSPPHSTPSFVVFAQTAYFLRFYGSSLPVLPRPVLSFILLSLFCPVLIPLTAFSPQCGSLSRKGGPGGSVSLVHGGTLLQPFQTCIHLLLEWATPLPVSAAHLMLVHCAFQWAGNSRAVGFLLFCQPQTSPCFSLLSSAQSSVTWSYGCWWFVLTCLYCGVGEDSCH